MTSSRALVVPSHGALTYSRYAVINQISIGAITIVVVIAAGISGVVGAFAWAGTLIAAAIALGFVGPVRREIDRHLACRADEAREECRAGQLRETSDARREQYRAVRCLVKNIEETNPDEARRFELQELLDELARLAAFHARCEAAILAGGDLPSDATVKTFSPRARDLARRRQELRDQCMRRARELAEHLDAIEQLVRLVAQRVACRSLDDELVAELDDRLAEIDRLDEASAELAV